ETLASVELTVMEPSAEDRDSFFSYLPENAWVLLVEPNDLKAEGRRFLERSERPGDFHTVERVFSQTYTHGTVLAERIGSGGAGARWRLPVESAERFSGDITRLRNELDTAAAGQTVYVVAQTEA